MSELMKTKLTKSERNIFGWAEFEYHPSAEEVAKLFWAMDAEEQAHFFNYVGAQDGFAVQMREVFTHPQIESQALWAASVIGEHGQ